MNHRNAIAVLALTATFGLAAAGCSSTSSSLTASHTPSSATTTSASPAVTPELPDADCQVVRPIAAGAIGRLMPLQTLPPDQAQNARATYLAELRTAQGKVTSTTAKTDLSTLITGLEGASSPDAGTAIMAAVTKLGTDCP